MSINIKQGPSNISSSGGHLGMSNHIKQGPSNMSSSGGHLGMSNHIKQGPSNIQLGILGSTEIAISQKKHSIHFPIRF
jgi:hypothetical protein